MTDNEIATLDIWELARKHHARVTTTCEFDFDELKNYTIEVWQAATAAEQERCALVCVAVKTVSGTDDVERGWNAAMRRVATAIRQGGAA